MPAKRATAGARQKDLVVGRPALSVTTSRAPHPLDTLHRCRARFFGRRHGPRREKKVSGGRLAQNDRWSAGFSGQMVPAAACRPLSPTCHPEGAPATRPAKRVTAGARQKDLVVGRAALSVTTSRAPHPLDRLHRCRTRFFGRRNKPRRETKVAGGRLAQNDRWSQSSEAAAPRGQLSSSATGGPVHPTPLQPATCTAPRPNPTPSSPRRWTSCSCCGEFIRSVLHLGSPPGRNGASRSRRTRSALPICASTVFTEMPSTAAISA
jgi:hypothetical protein